MTLRCTTEIAVSDLDRPEVQDVGKMLPVARARAGGGGYLHRCHQPILWLWLPLVCRGGLLHREGWLPHLKPQRHSGSMIAVGVSAVVAAEALQQLGLSRHCRPC